MANRPEPKLPILYKLRMCNLGDDCDTTVTVDSQGNVFSHTISYWNALSTFEREIADRQAVLASVYKDIEALRAIQRKVEERMRKNP